jgi:predicted P-loop ATPase/GTPase
MLISQTLQRLETYSPVIVLMSSPNCEVILLRVVYVRVVEIKLLHTLYVQDRAIVLKRDVNESHTLGVTGSNQRYAEPNIVHDSVMTEVCF